MRSWALTDIMRRRGVSLTLSLNPKSACEFAFGLQPIIKFIAWQAATLQMDFMCADPDFFVTRLVVCGNIFCVRLNLACTNLQSLMPLISLALALQCHV